MNSDFRELLSTFIAADVHFLLVGGYALAVHGYPRATRDMDVWVEATPENADRVLAGLRAFGAPIEDLTTSDLSNGRTVFQIGVDPNRIDVICGIDGVTFAEAWPNRTTVDVSGVTVPVIGVADLIRNKRSTGRLRDAADAEAIEGLLD
jgi:hypothetical protein